MSFLACKEGKESFTGKYQLDLIGLKNVSTGELEIVGESDDYFGKITFHSKKKRVFEIGLKHESGDSLHFTLPGGGGFLHLKKADSVWNGKFKYFGIKAGLQAKKIGKASNELEALVRLKPVGKGIISTEREEAFPCFDAKNQTLYFSREQKLFASKLVGSEWKTPEQLPFSKDFNDSAPRIFQNGQTLLFTSNRPAGTDSNKKNLWQVKKEEDAWQGPSPLPFPVNIDSLGDYHGVVSESGNVYFISYNREGGFGRSDIYSGALKPDGTFEVTNLGESVNSEMSEADVFVAPDEKYILFASTGREDSFGADDIYVSFKNPKGWSKPQNIGPKVNSFAYEYGPWVDDSNGFLYFNSYRRGASDIYRIKVDELEVFDKK